MATIKSQPIRVIKKVVGHDGHHGGAWKVAYADFVTALMALFIVLWLMNSSEQIRKAVAGYFNDPRGTGSLMGTTMNGTGNAAVANAADLAKLKEKLEEEIRQRKELQKLAKQIEITITPEGLRIELLEGKDGTFYQSGSARLSGSGQELLTLLATELKTLPNALLIEGHTDATQYSNDANYGNWELSADRANSARRLLQEGGVRRDQVTQVRGYADQMLRVKDNPADPSNRRVSILVKNEEGAIPNLPNTRVVGSQAAAPSPATAPSAGRNPPKSNAKPANGPATASNAAAPSASQTPRPQPQVPAKPPAGTATTKPGLLTQFKSFLQGTKK